MKAQQKSQAADTSEKSRLLKGEGQASKYTSNIGDDDDEVEDPTVDKDDKGSVLIVAFLLMLVFQLGNRIFGRLETFPMHNYPIFLNMISVFMYIPISFAYIIPMLMFSKVITKEQQEIPKYKFGVMGFYDSVAGVMQTFAVNYITNSSTIVLVQQSAIPISMLISRYALQAQYTYAQYCGAAVVLLGIVVVLVPTFFGGSGDSSGESTTELIWILVMVVSCVPMCLSSVYKEKALGETEIDVVYLNGWVAVFQFLIAIPLCFPSAWVINVPMDQIMPNLVNGARCWAGINSILEDSPGITKDDCSMAPYFVTIYLLFNIIYNILIIVILKHGSANIMWMASTVIVPLSNVAFSLNIMPGHKPLTVWDLVGLVVIMSGLVIYRFFPQLHSLYLSMTGQALPEDSAAERAARLVGKAAESKQARFLGLNQAEALQSLIDTRVMKATKKSLFRSPQQIRGTLFVKLGIPPSPMVSIGPRTSFNAAGSPQINPNSAKKQPRTRQLSSEV